MNEDTEFCEQLEIYLPVWKEPTIYDNTHSIPSEDAQAGCGLGAPAVVTF